MKLVLRPWVKQHKRKILTIGISVIFVLGGVYFYLTSSHYLPSLDVAAYRESDPGIEQTVTVPSPLAGYPVSGEAAKRRYMGVMIENSAGGARPQSGLDKADWVYESMAEGGITRFYVIFQSQDAKEVGPVRSARPYYVSWAAGMRAAYAHIGQSPEAIRLLKQLGDGVVPDINFGFRFGSGYKRVKFRFAPHNVFTSTKSIRAITKNIKQDKPGNYPGYLFKDDLASELRPKKGKVPRIDFGLFGGSYGVNYKYNKTTNFYKRYMGGAPHTDRVTKKQLLVKNIIVQFHPNPTYYPSGHGRINIKTVGKGKALLFRDGKVIKLTWRKKDHKSPVTYTTEDGSEAVFNRGGTTWVEVAVPYSKVSY